MELTAQETLQEAEAGKLLEQVLHKDLDSGSCEDLDDARFVETDEATKESVE